MEDLLRALERFVAHSSSDEVCLDVAEQLATSGKHLIGNVQARHELTKLIARSDLVQAWKIIASSFDVHADRVTFASEDSILAVALSLARLCRNALAGVQVTKSTMLECEPTIREVAFRVTSYDRIDDAKLFPLQRAIFQLLANLIAPVANSHLDSTLGELWSHYTDGTRESDIVSRSLDSKDPQSNMATLVLILHACTRRVEQNSNDGSTPLARSLFLDRPAGSGLMTKLMDKMTMWFEAVEGTKEHECFDLGYRVISKILDHGGHGDIYQMLARQVDLVTQAWLLQRVHLNGFHVFSSTNPITLAQITYLKLLDAWIEAGNLDQQDSTNRNMRYPASFEFLVTAEYASTRYAIPAMQGMSGAPSGTSISTGGDPLLPKVLQGSILCTQALVNLGLREVKLVEESLRSGRPLSVITPEIIGLMRNSKDRGDGFLEVLISYLRALEAFIPRVKPFRPPAKSQVGLSPPSSAASVSDSAFLPFATLKRDLVQLIGILVHDDKDAQDRTRECGGVELILSMCVTDEANPYIREHALFAVRNLMMGNADNQARIAEMEPLGVVGEDGELREMPERLGAKKK